MTCGRVSNRPPWSISAWTSASWFTVSASPWSSSGVAYRTSSAEPVVDPDRLHRVRDVVRRVRPLRVRRVPASIPSSASIAANASSVPAEPVGRPSRVATRPLSVSAASTPRRGRRDSARPSSFGSTERVIEDEPSPLASPIFRLTASFRSTPLTSNPTGPS